MTPTPSPLRRPWTALGVIAVASLAAASLSLAQTHAAKKTEATLLTEAELNPVQLLPSPPARGSALEQQQMNEVRTLGLGASPERIAQAKWDNDNEDPTAFDAAIGAGYEVKKMPATWELLNLVQHESDTGADYAKRYFGRLRPWGVDPKQPRRCEDPTKGTPNRSYPSGHSTLGYAIGMVYAQLLPAKAAAIQDRARDYALSRVICGEHFVSDTEASHVLAAVVVTKLMANPEFKQKFAKASAELAAAHVGGG